MCGYKGNNEFIYNYNQLSTDLLIILSYHSNICICSTFASIITKKEFQ